jgi:hypothetical protein
VRGNRSVLWGVILILGGAMLLLERFGHVHFPVGSFWPLILFVIGIGSLMEGQFGAAVMFVLLGAVFLAVTLGLYGLTYHNAWPLLMVAAGIGIVVRALTGESHRRSRRSLDHE